MKARPSLAAVLILVAAGCGRPVPKNDPSVTDPEQLFQIQCARCHARTGEPGGPQYGGSMGPPLAKIGSASGMSAEYIAEYIRDPKKKKSVSGVMPAFGGVLTDEQIRAVAEWLSKKK
ncbi:MAG TPA: c-type cytochrome [Gemmataceae bacterium]|nr:c-type cytochrome [Gemmataceae bacterium]